MKQLVNLLRELGSQIVMLFRALLVILLAALVLGGYLLYQVAIWIGEHPASLGLPPAALLFVWLLKRYVLRRKIVVEKDSAIIVRKAGGKLESRYRGWHKLRFGDTVCARLSLRPRSKCTNQEEVLTCDEERVRLSAVYDLHISDPLHFYFRGRKTSDDFTELNQWALLTVIQDFSFDDLYNAPFEINALVERSLNDQLRDYGLQVNNYRLDEVIWPEINERWKRSRSHLPLQDSQYWDAAQNLRPRLYHSHLSGRAAASFN